MNSNPTNTKKTFKGIKDLKTPNALQKISIERDLFQWDFFDTAQVATAFKIGVKEGFYHFDGLLVAHEAARHGKEIGIVGPARQRSHLRNPAERRADGLVLIERDIDAFTTATHSNTRIAFAAFHRIGGKVGKVGVIATIFAKSAKIFICNTFTFKVLNHCLLGLPTGMVAAKRHRQTRFKN